ncbi:MAG TPA: HlyD family efflux transporter periplasmic adaptor subunit [Flavisolibacter sp.]|nr:HlyD family efflux transporter periplasmic adaptor subunit [Flavisolibacter sp.]
MITTPTAYQHIYLQGRVHRTRYWYYAFFTLLLLILFLPWTQTIRGKGSVIALRQEQRPQQVNTIISGRISKWHIKEGDFVKKGDTLVQLTEIKDNYLDPQLLDRTREQITAKQSSIDYYKDKVGATRSQMDALSQALILKISGLQNKLLQTQIKLQSDSIEAAAAANDYRIATLQFNRQKGLFDSGLVSLTQLEGRNQSYQNTMAKKLSAENKYSNTKQDLNLLRIEMNSAQQEYAEKTAKVEGDRFQSLSEIATGKGEVAKLQNQYSSYSIRNGMYYILAPQDGQIIQAKKAGIGEIVKDGEMLVNIVPDKIQYAVELFVRPVDLPLVAKGQRVMFLFDGFPAIVFSGWPQASSGTFSGTIVAVEKAVSSNGKFRVLVAEDPGRKPWPQELKMGTGANGLALLKDVSVWYELWRNINSFPPDYYTPQTENKTTAK